MIATIGIDGKFSGVVYIELTEAIKVHHVQYGLTYCIIDVPLVNVGTEDTPDWGSPTASQLVPQSVTPRQARLALLQETLLDDVELLLANDKAMQIWWEYSLDVVRNHPHITAMGTALNLTEAQLDVLFILAATL